MPSITTIALGLAGGLVAVAGTLYAFSSPDTACAAVALSERPQSPVRFTATPYGIVPSDTWQTYLNRTRGN